MAKEPQYSNREVDRMFKEITDALGRIESQTTKTNGRVTKLERNMLIVFVALAVTTLVKFPEISKLFLNLI